MVPLMFGLAFLGVLILLFRGFALLRTDPLAELVPADQALIRTPVRKKQRATGPLDGLAKGLAPEFSGLLGPGYRKFMSAKIVQSGHADFADFAQFMALKVKLLLYALIPALALIVVLKQPLIAVLFLVLMFFVPDISLWSKASERQEQIEEDLPDFLDILSVTVSAGLSFRGALEKVIEETDGPLSQEMRLTLRQMDVGQSRTEAFTALRERTSSESLEAFVTSLLQSEELGSPLSDALEQIALDMRRMTAQRARKKASQANPKISAVVTLIMVPGTMLLIVAGMYYASGIDINKILGAVQ